MSYGLLFNWILLIHGDSWKMVGRRRSDFVAVSFHSGILLLVLCQHPIRFAVWTAFLRISWFHASLVDPLPIGLWTCRITYIVVRVAPHH